MPNAEKIYILAPQLGAGYLGNHGSQSAVADAARWDSDVELLWARWPRVEDWPGYLDLVEAAAFLRVPVGFLRRVCEGAEPNVPRIAHQVLGRTYRVSKAALMDFGFKPGTQPAQSKYPPSGVKSDAAVSLLGRRGFGGVGRVAQTTASSAHAVAARTKQSTGMPRTLR